jgi:hypothetical protein
MGESGSQEPEPTGEIRLAPPTWPADTPRYNSKSDSGSPAKVAGRVS